MAMCPFPGVVGVVFANQGDCASDSEYQEGKPRYLQPELVGNSGKVLQRSSGAAHHGAEGTASLHLLPRNPGGYSEFASS